MGNWFLTGQFQVRTQAGEAMAAKMNIKSVSFTLVNGRTFRGSINIGNSFRLSDFLDRSDSTFITMFDAVIENDGGKEVAFIDRNHIAFVKTNETSRDAAGSSSSEQIEIDGMLG
jgi:hypothetical protein